MMDSGKTLAEISDRYGAPNLSRVEELDEPMLSDVSIKMYPRRDCFSCWWSLAYKRWVDKQYFPFMQRRPNV